MSRENEVREASERFYEGLNRMARGETGAMAGIWAHNVEVTAMHPIGGRETGWDAVGSSFDQGASAASGGDIRLKDQRIQVVGDMAYEIGTESGSFTMAGQAVSIDQRVTNIYQRIDGSWKVVHHHADLSPAMIEIVSKL